MPDEITPDASAPIAEPAAVDQIEPVIDLTPEPAAEVPAVEDDKSTEAPETDVEVKAEAEVDDDPFAEFEKDAVKDESYYDQLFKTEKWKHVPHAARDEIRALVKANTETLSVIESIGGQPMLDTFKPVSEAILNPNVTAEQVEAAFDAIDTHNPKVIEQLGATFTKNWVQEVVKDPVTNLSPLMQHTFAQVFGKEAANYDLNRVLEFIQLDMARDSDGEPVLDIEGARELFTANGGQSAFKHQQEKAEYERRIQELQNGYQNNGHAAAPQITQPEIDVDKDLETDILPRAENVLTKLGYKKEDPEFSLFMDAMKYRLRSATETERIRGFAKNGSYKTQDGKYVQGVENNRAYLSNRLYVQLINEMKGVQARRKGITASPVSAAKLETQIPPVEQKTPTPPVIRDPKIPLTMEDIAAEAAANLRRRLSDKSAGLALAAGK